MRLAQLIACATAVTAAAGLFSPQPSAITHPPSAISHQPSAILVGQELPSRDAADIRTLVAEAGALPPEFAADTFIRLSGSPRITDALRRELLEQAFLRAYGAQEQYRRSSTMVIPPDSRQGARKLAYDTGLTRVSLQVRATQLLASVDRHRARELFEWIDVHPAAGACDDPLVAAVDEYYAALSLLARTTFATDRADAVRFLELYLWRAHLPSEMPAVARALQRFRPRADEAAYLETVFRLILEGGIADARGFSSADLDIVARVADLQNADRDIGVTGWRLMEALRAYLVRQLRGPRCSDSMTESMTPASFNGALKRLDVDPQVKPIDADSVRRSRMLGIARFDLYWQTPESRQLHNAAVRLYGPGRRPLPLKERLTKEWREQAEQLLTDVEQWQGTREPTERDHFYQKSVLFGGLIDLMPQSPVRTRALRTFVEFLRHTDVDRDRRALWFAFVTRLLEMARGADRREILATLEDSHHPVLSLYARLERLMPSSGASRRAQP